MVRVQALLIASVVVAFASLACGPKEPPEPQTPVGISTVPHLPMPDAPPIHAAPAGFRHKTSRIVATSGHPHHRVRDLLVAVGAEQKLEAKLAYGSGDRDLHDEDVVFDLEREPGTWDRSKVVRTSKENAGDDGGRAYLVVERPLELGRHRVKVTVVGDGTSAEGFVVVAAPRQRVFVSDVDGTLTSGEWAEAPALAHGVLPAPHPDAARIFGVLAQRGLVPVYLTARPEWLLPRTRAFLQNSGFPDGAIVTMRTKSGSFGDQAAAFKRGELARIASSFDIAWAFGNMPSDAAAYSQFVKDPKRRVLYQLTDAVHGCRRIDAYGELASDVAAP